MKRVLYLLGIDIGTSGLKGVLIDDAGQVLASSFREYSPDLPQPAWAEQDPDVWLDATISAVREMIDRSQSDPRSIAGISFSGQMHSTVLLDRELRSVRPAILWLDTRSVQQVETLRNTVGLTQLAEWIGNPVMPGFMLASLLWLKEHEPETWRRVAHVLQPKDYVRMGLTGQIATDYSDASSTALLDVRQRTWCHALLTATSIPFGILPPLCQSADFTGHLKREMAEAMNLPAGIPVVCGAGDQAAQAIGNGIIRPGQLSSTIGTGGQIFTPIDQYDFDPQVRMHVFCHAVPQLWHWEAATLSAGLSLRWLRDEVLGGRYSYAELAEAAATITPGAEGLMFLPYLAGERTPHMDPSARGAFVGLTLRHTWKHMALAVMEGVVLSLLDGLDLMRESGVKVEQVIASGGGTRHPLWLQLQADIFGVAVRTTQTHEAAAVGAALIAGVGAGVFGDFAAACGVAVKWNDTVHYLRVEDFEFYRVYAERWRDLYRVLGPAFRSEHVNSP